MGNRFRTPAGHRARARGRTGTLLACALLAGSLSALTPAAAHADNGTGTPPATSPDAAALAQAQATGQSVPVPADSTDESTTKANPDGTFTTTATTEPTQVEQNGSWVPLDPTLHQNTDGTWTPNAAASSVVFSGGGTSPLATVASAAGQQMSLSWPSPLPTPTVSGATATYPDVYPGVNLAMTATPAGGYTEQLIVTSATAAANPALANIQFNTSTNGLTLSTTAADGLQALDSAGDTVFASPTATMWSAPTAQNAAQSAIQAFTVHPADTSTSPSATPSVDDTAATDVGVTVTGNSVDLQPPTSALTGPGINYPVVIDPTVVPTFTNNWTWISKTNSGTSYWQGSNDDYTDGSDAKVGFDDWCSDGSGGCASTAFGVTRSLFSEDLDQFAGKHVTSATFTVYEQGSTSSWTGDREIDLYGAGAFDDKTTWSNAPATFAAYVPSQLASLPDSNEIGSGDFDVTTLIQNAVNSGYHAQTMVLEAHNESDDSAYRYLLSSGNYAPSLSVTYYSTPNVPSNLSFTNGTKTYYCNSNLDNASPGDWINASDSKTVTLNATVSTPDTTVASTLITSNFWVRETEPTLAAHWTNLGGQTVNSQSGGTVTHPSTSLTVADGETFEWQAYASEDSGAFSSGPAPSASSACWFSVDMTPPTLGSQTAAPPATVGSSPGTLQVSATDAGSGVASVIYNVNGTSLTAGGDETTVSASNGSTVTIPLPAAQWGTNTVWWTAQDAAGNIATPQSYTYHVAPNAYTTGTAGDLTGAGTPDLAAVDASGNIDVYTDPLAYTAGNANAGSVLIPASSAPGATNGSSTTGFAGALIAHNGSVQEKNCDDLEIIQNGQLAVEESSNCTASAQWTPHSGQRPPAPAAGTPTAAVNAYAGDWSQVQQLLALSSTETVNNEPVLVTSDLITLELSGGTDYLWEFPMDGASPEAPTLLASGAAWSDVTLINPGDISGHPALWTRNTTTGAMNEYLNIDTDTTNTLTSTSITTDTASPLTGSAYPLITAVNATGTGDTDGPGLWALDSTGTLQLIPTNIDSNDNPTVFDPGPVTASGWGTGITAIN
jgi:hypothetical protein